MPPPSLDIIIILGFGKNTKTKIWDVNVDNTVISKLVESKNNSKYLIRYLNSKTISFDIT